MRRAISKPPKRPISKRFRACSMAVCNVDFSRVKTASLPLSSFALFWAAICAKAVRKACASMPVSGALRALGIGFAPTLDMKGTRAINAVFRLGGCFVWLLIHRVNPVPLWGIGYQDPVPRRLCRQMTVLRAWGQGRP